MRGEDLALAYPALLVGAGETTGPVGRPQVNGPDGNKGTSTNQKNAAVRALILPESCDRAMVTPLRREVAVESDGVLSLWSGVAQGLAPSANCISDSRSDQGDFPQSARWLRCSPCSLPR